MQDIDPNQVENQQQFRNELFQAFKSNGIPEKLLAQLRGELVQKIQSNKENTGNFKVHLIFLQDDQNEFKTSSQFQTKKQIEFEKKLLSSLIYDYLALQNLPYTLSVFFPENCTPPNQLLSRQELDEYIQSYSSLYQDLKQKEKIIPLEENQSMLQMLMNVFLSEKPKISFNRYCQTEDYEGTLQDRMRKIDNDYLKKSDYYSLNSAKNMEDKYRNYKKEVEAMYDTKLQNEINNFKTYEATKIRVEEQERLNKKFLDFKKQLENEYQQKLGRVKDKENDALRLCTEKFEQLKRNEYELRQKYQEYMAELQEKEARFANHKCAENEVVQKESERLKELEKELESKYHQFEYQKKMDRDSREYEISKHQAMARKQGQGDDIETIKIQWQEDRLLLKNLQENVKNMEAQRSYMRSENETMRKEISDLQYSKNEELKEIKQLRENILTYREKTDNQQTLIDKFKTVNDQIKFDYERTSEAQKKIDQLLLDDRNLRQKYFSEIEGYQNEISNQQRNYIFKQKQNQNEFEKEKEKLQQQINYLEGMIEMQKICQRRQNNLFPEDQNENKQIDDNISQELKEMHQDKLGQIENELKVLREQTQKDIDLHYGSLQDDIKHLTMRSKEPLIELKQSQQLNFSNQLVNSQQLKHFNDSVATNRREPFINWKEAQIDEDEKELEQSQQLLMQEHNKKIKELSDYEKQQELQIKQNLDKPKKFETIKDQKLYDPLIQEPLNYTQQQSQQNQQQKSNIKDQQKSNIKDFSISKTPDLQKKVVIVSPKNEKQSEEQKWTKQQPQIKTMPEKTSILPELKPKEKSQAMTEAYSQVQSIPLFIDSTSGLNNYNQNDNNQSASKESKIKLKIQQDRQKESKFSQKDYFWTGGFDESLGSSESQKQIQSNMFNKINSSNEKSNQKPDTFKQDSKLSHVAPETKIAELPSIEPTRFNKLPVLSEQQQQQKRNYSQDNKQIIKKNSKESEIENSQKYSEDQDFYEIEEEDYLQDF